MNGSDRRQHALWPALIFVCMLAMAGISCSAGGLLTGGNGPAPTSGTKTPRPTFTPLPGNITLTPAGFQAVRGALPPGVTAIAPGAEIEGQATGSTNLVLFATPTPGPQALKGMSPTASPTGIATAPPTVAPSPTAFVVVSSATVNGRRGPGTDYEVVGEARQGQELMVLGRSETGDWWRVCCISNQPAWVSAGTVTINGAAENAPVMTPAPTEVPTMAPPPSITPTPTETPLPPFDIAAGPLFPIQRDNSVLTIWVKVYEGPLDNQTALPGYVLKVFRDDVDVSLPEQSHSLPFDHTNVQDAYNDLMYNLKFEMDRAGETKWRIYLARPGGERVSPITEFTTLGDAYRNLVVYIAYWLAR